MAQTEESATILKGLWEAIEVERNGYQFYRAAADRMSDPDGVRTFNQLAADEVEHEKILMERYRAVESTGEFPDAPLPAVRETMSRVFSDDFVDRVSDAHFEMSALGIGMTLEHTTMELYRRRAVDAPTTALRRFWDGLAEWEKGHYDLLHDEHERLKRHYWTESKFWPFG